MSCLFYVQAVLLCLCVVQAKPNIDYVSPKNILVFGGNGFLGSATVETLLEADHVITIVNRGNWYWDSVFTIKPRVQHISCDRGVTLRKCDGLVELVGKKSFDVVVDFSGYHPFAVTEAVDLLKDNLSLYIYISSDSVYEVCEKSHSEPSRETDDVRPNSEEVRNALAEKDDYGHRKLQCEEELEKQRQNGGFPYVSLRLPDVIGPRDNTYRWWIYQMWIKLSKYLEKPVSVPARFLNKPISLVYSQDVARFIGLLLQPNPEWLDQAYNLAFKETPSLLDVLTDMKMALNMTDLTIKTHTGEDAMYLFPSVRQGPVDISKAVDVLGWDPTPWEEAVLETVDFYESAVTHNDFDVPRKDIIRTMQSYFTSRPFKVLVGLRREYGLHYQGPNLKKDEL
ncbi:uncharacterized protein LOC124270260 [Haliotis rubra]|uniref:uncharacterized protein LOC124270260 n=1 Tax=Haliotis rubra TaxID=36100 RepID=UPI001EE533B8|nr:uncharacterized protein LOC124270260 [Haliotis rubra]